MEELCARLRKVLSDSGRQQNEVASILGISDRTLRNYLSGRTRAPGHFLRKFAQLFGVSVDYLLYGSMTNQAGPALSDSTVIDYNSGTSAQAHAGMSRNFGVESLCLDEYPTEEALVGELDEQIKTLLSVIRTQSETIRRLSAILAVQTQKPAK